MSTEQTPEWNKQDLEISVDHKVVVLGGAVADGAGPGGLLLVHHQEERGVETLQVVAGGRAAGHRHPHLA